MTSTPPAPPAPPAVSEPKPKPKPEPAVAAGSPSTRIVTRSDGPANDYIRPNLTEGLTPLEQIERRNQASRADASVQAAQRAAAASRALGFLQAQIDADRAEIAATKVEPELTPPPAAAPSTPAAPAPKAAPRPTPKPEPVPVPEPVDEAAPLLEVKTSPLGADLEHLGDRLAIFVDRVELRDRLDRVRNSIKGVDIVDVVVNKRLTGAVVTIESVHGAGIAAKGLRPDQADEARQLILDKTRPARLAGRNGDNETDASTVAAPEPVTTSPAPATPKVDAVALRSKLADLHNAGVLTHDEYQQKLLVVRRLANGETLRTG